MKPKSSRTAMLAGLAIWAAFAGPGVASAQEPKPLKLNTTADHSKFKELQREFKSGPEVTAACLGCHTEAALQIHRTKHWKWEYLNPDTKQMLGKKTVVNNFCISIASNYASCTSCHVGYGWADQSFDFKSERNVDCLVCHDTTGNYRKLPGLAGNVVTKDLVFPAGSGKMLKAIDLGAIAQKVGKSSRDTCGTCHFNGGGGDGVKHGDLDTSMAAPDKALDVHMDAAGLDFTCAKVVPEGYPAWVKAYGAAPNAVAAPAGAKAPAIEAGKESGSISVSSFERIYKDAPASVHLIDVREPAEVAGGSFKGAINMPINSLEKNLDKLPRDKPIIFFCGAGGHSGEAHDMVRLYEPELKTVFLDADIKWTKDGGYTISAKG